MLICAIDSLFVLENPNFTKPTQIILVFKKQSPRYFHTYVYSTVIGDIESPVFLK